MSENGAGDRLPDQAESDLKVVKLTGSEVAVILAGLSSVLDNLGSAPSDVDTSHYEEVIKNLVPKLSPTMAQDVKPGPTSSGNI